MNRRRPTGFGSNVVEFGGWLVSGILIACGGGYWAGLRSVEPEAAAPRASMASTALARVGRKPDRPAAASASAGDMNTAASIAPPLPAGLPAGGPVKGGPAGPRAPSGPVRAPAPPGSPADGPGTRPASPASPDGGSQPPAAVARLGAFSEMGAAAAVWGGMERAYPELRRHPAGIIQNRGRDGRLFYQFEVDARSLDDALMLCAGVEQLNYQCEAERR